MRGAARPVCALGGLALVLAPPLTAQESDVSELCPNLGDTGVLIGVVSDTDAQMALPGATVRATWEKDGTPGSAETQAGLDGSFAVCYVPLDLELAVQAYVGPIGGETTAMILTAPVTRHDVGFSLIGDSADAETHSDRIWACVGPPDSQIRLQLGSLVRCDPQWPSLDRCPQRELEKVTATAGSRGRGAMREMVDQLVDKAEGLGANALVDFSGGRGSIEALAVVIEVDPTTC